MAVEVVVPWHGGCPHRERAWQWVRGRYEAEGWNVVEAPAPDGPWCKAAAVTPAVEASDADIVVVADADCWTDGLADCVAVVERGRAWAMPHGKVVRLSEAGTGALFAGENWMAHRPVERADEGVCGGGVVALRREVYLDCPFDPRYLGWGQEDTSWARALVTLHGDVWRGKTPLVHCWHPPQPRIDRQKGSAEGWRLFRRYRKARDNAEAMRALIDEAKEGTWAPTG